MKTDEERAKALVKTWMNTPNTSLDDHIDNITAFAAQIRKETHEGIDAMHAQLLRQIGDNIRAQELEKARGLVEALELLHKDFQCGVAHHETWALEISAKALAAYRDKV